MGRPKKKGVAREPNGRVSRAEERRREERRVAWQRRHYRPFVESRDELLDPLFSHYAGALRRTDRITEEEYDAAIYLYTTMRLWRLVMNPNRGLRAQNIVGVSRGEVDFDDEQVTAIKRRADEMTRELISADPQSRPIYSNPYASATVALAVRDEPLNKHLLEYARVGLQRISKAFIHKPRRERR